MHAWSSSYFGREQSSECNKSRWNRFPSSLIFDRPFCETSHSHSHSLSLSLSLFPLLASFRLSLSTLLLLFSCFIPADLHSTPLTLSSESSLIHSSISIDSPLLSFSSFQPLLTGMNGLKPNLDIYNTFQRILSRVGSNVDSGKPGYGTTIPIRFDLNEERKYGITYNVEDTQRQREEREERERLGERRIWEWNLLSNPAINRLIGKGEEEREFRFGEWLESYFRLGQRGMEKLRRSNGNFWRDGFKMVRGTTDGPSGVLNRFHVDSFTIYATPDVAGPYRTKELGR